MLITVGGRPAELVQRLFTALDLFTAPVTRDLFDGSCLVGLVLNLPSLDAGTAEHRDSTSKAALS
jgi:hypothetical protein